MSQQFAIGERALCVSRKGNGTRECIVTEGLARREVEPGEFAMAYIVEIPGVRSSAFDGCWNVYAWQLIKRQPPTEEAVPADALEVIA